MSNQQYTYADSSELESSREEWKSPSTNHSKQELAHSEPSSHPWAILSQDRQVSASVEQPLPHDEKEASHTDSIRNSIFRIDPCPIL
ncbi:uncharacterized protein BO97DRAFT_42861 [Aspergillus homomorphus CBS 101889]|uniref:Uncharacterized protein n=1 Tax=Aspergillus homomorphus (strain CBS 101889) TaxID=1450537 RepID=A0A395HHM2_ASPHC|nr:hypothetical protein BO97DRAFT_42861 [Aspergillus homomorphus CBS 101889]RAL06478.1 hypothetical protein BO97DRAFT_42861 [Aspergillus homomorphus CBS 101889]